MADESVIVADAGPLIALATVSLADVLPQIYPRVILPATVRAELMRGAPRPGSELVDRTSWLEVMTPTRVPDARLSSELDPGEAEAITIAVELGAATVLLDDLRARRVAAADYGLPVIGYLGILVRARRQSLVGPLGEVFARLQAAGIRLSDELVERALRSVGER